MIRPATFADLWALKRKPVRRIYFYNDALLASSYHASFLGFRSMLDPMGTSSDQRTLVLRDHGLWAMLQASRRPNKRELDLQLLSLFARRGRQRHRDGDLIFRLIEDLLKRSGSNEIERVYAAIGARAEDVVEVLRQLGFQPYAQQTIWMLPEPTLQPGSAIVALRRQKRHDAWAIHQLYSSITPRHVRQAEMRDSTSWDIRRSRQIFRHPDRAWVLGDDSSLTVYLRLHTGTRNHVLHPLIAPHLSAETPAMVRYMLSQLHDGRPVFAVLRSYQSELRGALEELGFVERGEQTLFVKHLALMSRQPVFRPAFLRNEQSEGVIPASTVASIVRDGNAV